MAKLTVEGVGTFEVPDGKRLVLALMDDARLTSCTSAAGMRDARHAECSLWPASRTNARRRR